MQYADISYNQSGTPTSNQFDDVYFSNQNGLEESDFVFFQGNDLEQRIKTAQQKYLTVFETGFGTGLNFLNTWHRFLHLKQEDSVQTLHFISCEKYPIAQQDLAAALKHWPSLISQSNALLKQYPLPIPGCHRLVFENGRVLLDLWFGDVNDILPQLENTAAGLVDAWYLDGFAPSKNPEMWTTVLFNGMAKLSKAEATFATFTSAGAVRRGLQSAGFGVTKVKGFGRKREMLVGQIDAQTSATNKKPANFPGCYRTQAKQNIPLKVAVVGAGLAAANLAYSLSQKGIPVAIYCQDTTLAMGASGNAQGGFYPHLTADFSLQSQLYALSFGFAKRRYLALMDEGLTPDLDYCGVFLAGFSEEVTRRQKQLLANKCWPKQLVAEMDAEAASAQLGLDMAYPGLWMPEGGWVNPAAMCNALVAAAARKSEVELHFGHKLTHFQQQGEHWELSFSGRAKQSADILILAPGSGILEMQLDGLLPFQAVRGQVESLPSEGTLAGLKSVICHKGYLTPALNGQHAMGATFVKQDLGTDVRAAESQQNADTIAKALPGCGWAQHLPTPLTARASTRLTLPDHLPVADALPDIDATKRYLDGLGPGPLQSLKPRRITQAGLFCLAGLGSRGLCTAPLLSEVIACQLSGRPLPLNRQQLAAIAATRFLLRQLKKQN